jgi:predicted O-methyltransferase YrrM
LSARPLAFALGALVRAQRRRLPTRGALLAEAARLALAPDEAEAEATVDALRRDLAADGRSLLVRDHGAGTRGLVSAEAKPPARRVADVYRRAAASPGWGRFLFRLVRGLRPTRVLELGTSLGVSAAHLALALALNDRERGTRSRLVTVEGDPGLAALARGHLARAGVAGRVAVVEGRFADVLPGVLAAHGPFDLAFLDGHHEEAATLAYWRTLGPHLAPGACVAFDDVEPGRPVRRAWTRIAREETAAGAEAVDLLGLGLLFLPASGAARAVRASDPLAVAAGQ